MPIRGDASKVLSSMKDQYGSEKGERIFYATAEKQRRTPETWAKKANADAATVMMHRPAQPNRRPFPSDKPINEAIRGANRAAAAGVDRTATTQVLKKAEAEAPWALEYLERIRGA